MITKKNLLTALLFLFVSCPMWSQILKSSGIIVKAGKGEIAYNTPTHIDNMDTDIKNSYIKGKAALEFGYRFRLQTSGLRTKICLRHIHKIECRRRFIRENNRGAAP